MGCRDQIKIRLAYDQDVLFLRDRNGERTISALSSLHAMINPTLLRRLRARRRYERMMVGIHG